jgi:hypothetical protein
MGLADKRGALIKILEDALTLADEIADSAPDYLIERALASCASPRGGSSLVLAPWLIGSRPADSVLPAPGLFLLPIRKGGPENARVDAALCAGVPLSRTRLGSRRADVCRCLCSRSSVGHRGGGLPITDLVLRSRSRTGVPVVADEQRKTAPPTFAALTIAEFIRQKLKLVRICSLSSSTLRALAPSFGALGAPGRASPGDRGAHFHATWSERCSPRWVLSKHGNSPKQRHGSRMPRYRRSLGAASGIGRRPCGKGHVRRARALLARPRSKLERPTIMRGALRIFSATVKGRSGR